MAKEDFKNAGTELGHAFKSFGKTFVRSARATIDKVDDYVNEDGVKEEPAKEPTVYSDGSWRKTGKELGGAFKSLGSAVLKTVEEKADQLDQEVQK